MKKVWIIVAVSLIFLGCVIFGGVMTKLKWDFNKLSTAKYETNQYQLTADYKNISIKGKNEDIIFMPSDDINSIVVCYEQEKVKHSVNVVDGTLVIDVTDMRKWYEHIGVFFDTPKVTLYIPKGEYGQLTINASTGDVQIPKEFWFENIDISISTGSVKCLSSASGNVKIKLSTGDIKMENISADSIELSVTTGDVMLADVTCEGIRSNGSTGDITLKSVVAKRQFFIKRSTGGVRLDKSDGGEIIIKTSTGDIKGSLLSDKVFITNADTGSVNVPETTTGGKCQLTTDTGDIRIKIEK